MGRKAKSPGNKLKKSDKQKKTGNSKKTGLGSGGAASDDKHDEPETPKSTGAGAAKSKVKPADIGSGHDLDIEDDQEEIWLQHELESVNQALKEEEARIKKQEIQKAIHRKKEKLEKLKGITPLTKKPKSKQKLSFESETENESEESESDEITLKSLQKNAELNKKVEKQLKKYGVGNSKKSKSECKVELDSDDLSTSADSEEEKSDVSTSDSSEDESESKKKSKHKKSKKLKSGMLDKPSDKIKHKIDWPQSELNFEYVNSPIKFSELEFDMLVAGELEILSSSKISKAEKRVVLSY